ncbi:MAG: DUF2298 domain-containing protein [Dehalococcoidia bacterium]
MSETLVWWVMMQVVGLAALPLCLSLFRRLPDRGYALSKPFALLLIGYVFWILVILGLPNSTRAIWLVLLLVGAASGVLLWRSRDELLGFAREHLWLIGATELLFFVAFITAAYLRSYVPDFGGTEKPMDLMFLNAVTRSDSFPPADAWLAGESVSYYYFGYLLVSIMTRLSSLATSVGFNLGLAMIVALASTAAFGLVYNLAAPREQRLREAGPGTPGAGFASKALWRPMVFGFVGALLLVFMGNLEGLLELLAAHDFGSEGFWSWIGVAQLGDYDSSKWFPDQFWFWWRATRILDGGAGIHEMPFFSFMLGDLHPHVMSIPFVLLAVGGALALLRSDEPLDLVVWLERPLWLVGFALMLGGLAFLNTWDMPTMAFLMAFVVVIRNRLLAARWSWGLALDSAGFLAPLYFTAFLAFSPFFFGGFDSQASGFTAEIGAGSGLFHAFLLWGLFAAIVLPYAAWRLASNGEGLTRNAVLWSLAPAAAIVLLWLVWDGLAAVLGWLPGTVAINEAGFERGADVGLGSRISERGWNWLSVIVLGGCLSALGLALFREVECAKDAVQERVSHIMALGLAATATLLILGAEFIYIEDGFNSRLNTIFKLYYQAWILLSLAGGFVLYELARAWRLPSTVESVIARWSLGEYGVLAAATGGAIAGVVIAPSLLTSLVSAVVGAGIFFVVAAGAVLVWRSFETSEGAKAGAALSWRGVWAGAAVVALFAALIYPVTATFNRTNDFDLPRGLDGLERIPASEQAAVAYLNARDGQPVIAEALGGDYTDGGRISASTGLPTLLQWPGHELQWRGDSAPQEGREADLEVLYTSNDPDAVRSVIEKYGISYVVVGDRERDLYQNVTPPDMTDLFETALEGEVAIYRVRPGVISEVVRE